MQISKGKLPTHCQCHIKTSIKINFNDNCQSHFLLFEKVSRAKGANLLILCQWRSETISSAFSCPLQHFDWGSGAMCPPNAPQIMWPWFTHPSTVSISSVVSYYRVSSPGLGWIELGGRREVKSSVLWDYMRGTETCSSGSGAREQFLEKMSLTIKAQPSQMYLSLSGTHI